MLNKTFILSILFIFIGIITVNAQLTSGYDYIGGEYPNGSANLTYQISATDDLQGVTGTILSGGFHSATEPSDNNDRLETLTDGIFASNGLTVICQDYGGAGSPPANADPALVIEYTLPTNLDITTIRIFAGHSGDGHRGWINCDIEIDSGSGYSVLINNLKTGAYDQTPQSNIASAVYLYDASGAAIASNVEKIKFSFYGVSNSFLGGQEGWFKPPGTDGVNGTILKEIDVFGEISAAISHWEQY